MRSFCSDWWASGLQGRGGLREGVARWDWNAHTPKTVPELHLGKYEEGLVVLGPSVGPLPFEAHLLGLDLSLLFPFP